MSEKTVIVSITPPFSLDRRDSAIMKRNPGILYELSNFFIHNGSLEVRQGITRFSSSQVKLTLEPAGAYRLLALHRYYGYSSTDTALKEFYVASKGSTNSYLYKGSGGSWTSLTLPTGITLSTESSTPPASQSNFQQFKDETYYTNFTEPVLMIRKEDTQVYEAGVPDPNRYKMIANCNTLTNWSMTGTGSYALDNGFERHTEGDYGITMSVTTGTGYLKRSLGSTFNLTQFDSGTSSSEYDYIAIDIFRFSKAEIDEVVLELASTSNFTYGFRCVIYADSDYTHFNLNQRTMLAEWAMNPYSNRLFFGKFRKKWFIPITATATSGSTGSTLVNSAANFPTTVVGKTITNLNTGVSGTVLTRPSTNTITTDISGWSNGVPYKITDLWTGITNIRVKLMRNAEAIGSDPAKITIDNIRLLKSPPVPAQLSLQVATCDALESWTVAATGAAIADDYVYATEGVSCKKIPINTLVQYDFGGNRDLFHYGEGTEVGGGDEFVFDVCGTGANTTLSLYIDIYLLNSSLTEYAAARFYTFENIKTPQRRSVYLNEFSTTDGFSWESVRYLRIYNPPSVGFPYVYIDNIRIQPSSPVKTINRFFAPADLAVGTALDYFIEQRWGENSVYDILWDALFDSYKRFTRRVVGNGSLVWPEYKHGRYKLGDYTLGSMQMQVDAGGQLSVTIKQDDDFTEYEDFSFSKPEDFSFNLDSFWGPKKYSDSTLTSTMGWDWVEIPATPSDKFSIWMSTPDITAITEIIFRFYCNKNATWTAGTLKHQGASGVYRLYNSSVTFTGLNGHRIRNETQGTWGIIGWASGNYCAAWGMTWNLNDTFSISGGTGALANKGFGFSVGTPDVDPDNYYEYIFDVKSLMGSLEGVVKGYNKAIKWSSENEEAIEAARELAKDYGISIVYQSQDSEGDQWWQGVFSWKRSDMVAHLSGAADSPWSSMQCIAAHEIMVRASTKKQAIINFQDFKMERQGEVSGEIQYKMKLEDDKGFIGPSTDASKKLTVKGANINLSGLYVPSDTRIKRKRIYRLDSEGTFRYLDTIDRQATSYLDQIPEELLGMPIEEDLYPPPRAKRIRKGNNRMAYINCRDRRGFRRSSRIHFSLPFVPHQCRDEDCFDLVPEDGQEVVWCEWYYGFWIVWKERSMYAIDPTTFEVTPREPSIGCIAPFSVAAIPGGGFGWLSHEGVCFGDHSSVNKEHGLAIWDDINNYTISQLSKAVGFYHDDYYYIFLGYDNSIYNTKGYGFHIPSQSWTSFSGLNVQCVSIFNGGTDNNEIYTGSNYGYVNRLFYGESDLADTLAGTSSNITSSLRTLDYDLTTPASEKYISWLTFHAKNISADPTRQSILTITPYYDQIPVDPLDDVGVIENTYIRFPVCHDPGFFGSLVGFKLEGVNRYAIKEFVLDVTDVGFRPPVR